MSPKPLSPYAVGLAAALALAVAMGIGRFAFTPMLPLMIGEGAISLDASPWIAGANYFGYLIGAVTAGRLRASPEKIAGAGLIGTALSTLAMGAIGAPWAWAILRGFSGLFSGWVLVGVSAWALFLLAQAGRSNLSALVYAGVGSGIALTGLFCMLAPALGASSSRMWLELGWLSAIISIAPLYFLRGPGAARPPPPTNAKPISKNLNILVWCYGAFGFGYILPATYLPTLARQMIDDPRIFGLVWPLFGLSAAVSTLCVGARCIQDNRLRAWALCQFVMALGAVLPSLWRTPLSLGISTICIGGAFMVITSLGLQEARLRAPENSAKILGRMTAAFALGQLAGPLALVFAPAQALNLGLQCAALVLLISAALLWRSPKKGV